MRVLACALLGLVVACGGANNGNNDDNIGTAEITSDDVNGVNANDATFAFFAGAVSNGLDLDNGAGAEDSFAVTLIFLSDSPTLCDDLNTSILSGQNNAIDTTGLGGTIAVITATKRTLNADSDLTDGEPFQGDGVNTQVSVSWSVSDGTILQASAQGDQLGQLNLTANDDGTFNGDFSGAQFADSSGQAAFDLDTDADGVPDATAINTSASGSFSNAQLCAGLEGIALLLSIFGAIGG